MIRRWAAAYRQRHRRRARSGRAVACFLISLRLIQARCFRLALRRDAAETEF